MCKGHIMEKQRVIELLNNIESEIINNTENEVVIHIIKDLKSNKCVNDKFYEILKRIEICLKNNVKRIAIDYINLEIENFKGITEINCKSTKYYYDDYCKYCSNLNCNSNKNKIK